jgi:hypothetical protein
LAESPITAVQIAASEHHRNSQRFDSHLVIVAPRYFGDILAARATEWRGNSVSAEPIMSTAASRFNRRWRAMPENV